MTKPKLLVLGTQDDWDLTPLGAAYDLVEVANDADPADIDPAIRAEVTLGTLKGHRAVTAEMFDLFPAMKVFANYGVGYDAIDIAAATARGIRVSNTPDVLTDDVADHAVVMLLAFLRQTSAAEAWLRTGNWAKNGEFALQRSLSRGTVGILGLGRIGRAVADRLAAFSCDIHYYARSEKQVPEGWTYHADTQSLARAVDYLVVCISGGPATVGLVDAATIAALGPDGVLVNVSRGTTVDEAALLDALAGKTIAGAALDVFLNEPHIDPRFLTLDNVLLQPHVASGTVDTRKAMGVLVRENLRAGHEGRELVTPVN